MAADVTDAVVWAVLDCNDGVHLVALTRERAEAAIRVRVAAGAAPLDFRAEPFHLTAVAEEGAGRA